MIAKEAFNIIIFNQFIKIFAVSGFKALLTAVQRRNSSAWNCQQKHLYNKSYELVLFNHRVRIFLSVANFGQGPKIYKQKKSRCKFNIFRKCRVKWHLRHLQKQAPSRCSAHEYLTCVWPSGSIMLRWSVNATASQTNSVLIYWFFCCF